MDAGVISHEVAGRIEAYYAQHESQPPVSKLVIAFGILGSLLVGLGIVLILAHNWDQLSRDVKTSIAFIPLIVGQLICAYTLWKKNESTVWREAGSVFLVLAMGTCMSLISQIYNIPGNVSSFMLTWVLLALPVVYIMRSSMASLLYIAGITYYACEVGFWSYPAAESYLYWGLVVLILPHYIILYKNKPDSNFFTFHNWCIPLSVICVLGTVATAFGELMFIAYMSLFGCLYAAGHTPVLRGGRILNNGYLVSGSLGTVVMLLILSFDWFWQDLRRTDWSGQHWIMSPEGIAAIALTLLALVMLVIQKKNQQPFRLNLLEPVFILFIGIFLLGMASPLVVLLVNLLLLAIGVLTIREGARHNHFGILNYGLLVITALIIARFFDTNLSFVFRGVLFVAVGLGFFYANYWMMQRGKAKAKAESMV